MTNSPQYCKLPQYNEKGEPYPWKDEPNFAYYTDENTGLDYFIKRNHISGVLGGYIILQKTATASLDESMNNFDFDRQIIFYHTFIIKDENLSLRGRVIGFECDAILDLSPLLLTINQRIPNMSYIPHEAESYKDIKYVQEECKKLAAQVADYLKKYKDKVHKTK